MNKVIIGYYHDEFQINQRIDVWDSGLTADLWSGV